MLLPCNNTSFRRLALIVFALTFPYISGSLELADRARVAARNGLAPPAEVLRMARVAYPKADVLLRLLKLTYDRDAAGLIWGIAEARPNANDDFAWTYGYDGLKRLTSAVKSGTSGGSYAYEYDRRGNRIKETKGTVVTVSRYNALDQLVEEQNGSGVVQKKYQWDSLGRMTKELSGTDTQLRAYGWSADDLLLEAVLGSGSDAPRVRYNYDHSGTRVARSALDGEADGAPEVRRYLADYQNLTGYSQVLAEANEEGAGLRNYVYGQDHLALAQRYAGANGAHFLHGDHFGTTRQLTNGDGLGALNAAADYEPFGSLAGSSSDLGSLTDMQFTGQDRETATALQYHRARWLNTGQGRWLSEDPVFDFPGNFGNGYGYVGGNAIGLLDPTGTLSMGELATGAAIGGIVNGLLAIPAAMQAESLGDAIKIIGLEVLIGAIGGALGVTLGPLVPLLVRFTKVPGARNILLGLVVVTASLAELLIRVLMYGPEKVFEATSMGWTIFWIIIFGFIAGFMSGFAFLKRATSDGFLRKMALEAARDERFKRRVTELLERSVVPNDPNQYWSLMGLLRKLVLSDKRSERWSTYALDIQNVIGRTYLLDSITGVISAPRFPQVFFDKVVNGRLLREIVGADVMSEFLTVLQVSREVFLARIEEE